MEVFAEVHRHVGRLPYTPLKEDRSNRRFRGSEVEAAVAQTILDGALHDIGYDYLHVTSGGNAAEARIPGTEPGYQVPFARAVKQAVPQAVVIAVGMILEPAQAEAIIAAGDADMIAIARAALDDPNWGHHAATALGVPQDWPVQYQRAGHAVWPTPRAD